MTATADITVVPTGGSVPVDLADIAARVATIPTPTLIFWPPAGPMVFSSGADHVVFTLAKQSGGLEDFAFTIDSTPFTPTGTAYTYLPDGIYGYTLNSVPNTSGMHTVAITCSSTGANCSGTYTV